MPAVATPGRLAAPQRRHPPAVWFAQSDVGLQALWPPATVQAFFRAQPLAMSGTQNCEMRVPGQVSHPMHPSACSSPSRCNEICCAPLPRVPNPKAARPDIEAQAREIWHRRDTLERGDVELHREGAAQESHGAGTHRLVHLYVVCWNSSPLQALLILKSDGNSYSRRIKFHGPSAES